jgi:hypothetical protein
MVAAGCPAGFDSQPPGRSWIADKSLNSDTEPQISADFFFKINAATESFMIKAR